MEVRIGVRNVSRELSFETSMTAEEVAKAVAAASGGAMLDLSADKGRRILVPGDALGYVEIGQEERHRVGFEA
ncbi:DUF3107 domain-containing protein [Demequina capsici]|uniref:DUF3107 domain-containing protein n=1 Tax=Demequina capsici TaxID=3075620 RepID=A0AA96F8G0_9MICO|nr:DUF3107 domain-containing protein [Demequina sp. OYTSA14]WNM23921.1 DUF3107 domain-containing protein [Demequina sp. OYTSA14]